MIFENFPKETKLAIHSSMQRKTLDLLHSNNWDLCKINDHFDFHFDSWVKQSVKSASFSWFARVEDLTPDLRSELHSMFSNKLDKNYSAEPDPYYADMLLRICKSKKIEVDESQMNKTGYVRYMFKQLPPKTTAKSTSGSKPDVLSSEILGSIKNHARKMYDAVSWDIHILDELDCVQCWFDMLKEPPKQFFPPHPDVSHVPEDALVTTYLKILAETYHAPAEKRSVDLFKAKARILNIEPNDYQNCCEGELRYLLSQL